MFKPWIGEGYRLSRILIMGESTYDYEEQGVWEHPTPAESLRMVHRKFVQAQAAELLPEAFPRGCVSGTAGRGAASICLEPPRVHQLHFRKRRRGCGL